MPFVPEIAQPCPEPETKVNMTYELYGLPLKSCYEGYYQGVVVIYYCTGTSLLEGFKILLCSSGGNWTGIDTAPWPTCKTPPEPTNQPTPPKPTNQPTSPEPTNQTGGNNGNSGKMSFKILHLIREHNGKVFELT
jgi:hypothetical protein